MQKITNKLIAPIKVLSNILIMMIFKLKDFIKGTVLINKFYHFLENQH